MPLDSNIILQQREIKLENPMDSYAKALSLKQMALQNQKYETDQNKQQTVKDILKRRTSVGLNGQIQVDRAMALKDLVNEVGPEEAMDYQKQLDSLDLEKREQITKAAKQFAFSVTPENYAQTIKQMEEMGLPNTDKFPPVYDPNFIQRWQVGTLEGEKQLEQKWKEKNYQLEQQKLAIQNREANRKAQGGESLPLDQKKVVETLATKNATKLAIKNQIEAVMNTWDNLSDDQKVVQGRSLLKTLNSTEGADAIGAEEAKRLGGLLEFKVLNLTEPGSVIGRDLSEFKTQALAAAKNIGTAVESNQSQIDQAMGRKPKTSNATKPSWAL